jgi:2-polyprenyl-6-methoxyphenol hydroxylase-like FAD-dependent oxidoreductase
MMKFDAVIVGARCAGAATALLLARTGARVLLVDKGTYGSDTLSTHALMRGAVLQLHRWGVLPAIVAAGTPPVHSTTFSYVGQDVTVAIEPKFGVGALYAPRRSLLDRALVDAAADSGAEITYGVRVDDVIVDHRGRVRGITALVDGARRQIEADLVIGADGLYSTVARRVNAPCILSGQHSTGVLYSYWEGVPVDGYHWQFRTGASIGAIPTNHRATCVFVSMPSARFRRDVHGQTPAVYRRLLRDVSPSFDARLDGGRQVEPVRGHGGHSGFMKRSTGPGWALVGDAGYFKDPLTAHGITDALRDAELLTRAIIPGTAAALEDYEATRLDLSRRLFEVTDQIASFAWTDDSVQSLHRAFSSEMSREVRALAALEPLACLTQSASVPRAV